MHVEGFRSGLTLRQIIWATRLCFGLPLHARGQTPSPLQEWQFPGGIILPKEFELKLPEWRTVLGAAMAVRPLYDGARPYKVQPGPAGPSLTFADGGYMQNVFGVTPLEAVHSGYPGFNAHGGLKAAGFGFSSTWFVNEHWLVNCDAAVSHLLGSAGASSITERPTQGLLALALA